MHTPTCYVHIVVMVQCVLYCFHLLHAIHKNKFENVVRILHHRDAKRDKSADHQHNTPPHRSTHAGREDAHTPLTACTCQAWRAPSPPPQHWRTGCSPGGRGRKRRQSLSGQVCCVRKIWWCNLMEAEEGEGWGGGGTSQAFLRNPKNLKNPFKKPKKILSKYLKKPLKSHKVQTPPQGLSTPPPLQGKKERKIFFFPAPCAEKCKKNVLPFPHSYAQRHIFDAVVLSTKKKLFKIFF